jgi:hypothetical protein
MSTPQGWQAPKTNWQSPDPVGLGDFNRIEGNAAAIETGDRTLDPAQAPTSNTGTLGQILNWIANRIKAIMGTTNWWDAPPITLKALSERKIAAGNGLTGGGDMLADRTITLGTPGTITATTSNNVTSTSHTHALSGISRIAAGSYVGDGEVSRTVSVGFTPKCVILVHRDGSSIAVSNSSGYPKIVSGGFVVSGSSPGSGNYQDRSYDWVAFA